MAIRIKSREVLKVDEEVIKMNSFFVAFRLMWQAKRPKQVLDMRAMACPFWIKQGYEALTFFGTIITHTQKEAEDINTGPDELKNHEMIHLYQARSTGNSWFLFYIRYLWYSLSCLRYSRRLRNSAYLLNPFEMEAYTHMCNRHYLEQCGHKAEEWRVYAKMTLEQRLRFYKKRLKDV